jgi:hypothetical protein
VLSGDREAMAKLSMDDLMKILAATLTGMNVDQFEAEAKSWLESAEDPRWKRHYLYDEANKQGRVTASINNDWKRIFAFEE